MPVDFYYNHLRRSASIPCLPNRLEEPNSLREASRPLSRARIHSVPKFRQGDYELRYQYRPEGTQRMVRAFNLPDPVWYDRRYTSPYLSYWPYYSLSTPPNYYRRHPLAAGPPRSHLDPTFNRSYLRTTKDSPGSWHSYWLTPQYYKRKACDWPSLKVDMDLLSY